ncbi:fimbrial protein [Xenorhabdus japonica]|uniref:Major type 1 subunit fimbrin (Pilin) n=1 Tax=Xenorhabdus japonica TaxID=53341 RepID=A0A1I5BQH2_9GAMM|nr:fimbrial protein [Xenorhabdus japonica]SFN76918.1 major type 1 subunit fimbrin (pilin) [Xenorhabdus japonica]
MKKNKIFIIMTTIASMGVFNVGNANTTAIESGTVNFQGVVTNSPCNIAHDSIDQTVKFGHIGKAYLDSGNEYAQEFKIKLEQCAFNQSKNFTIQFRGLSDTSRSELKMIGTAKNVAVKLTTDEGKAISIGTNIDSMELKKGTNILGFIAYAKKEEGATEVSEGDFQGKALFDITYN